MLLSSAGFQRRRFSVGLRRPAAALLVLLMTALPTQAQWKWRDASGRIQFSDMPPPSQVPDKDILQRPGPPGASRPPTAAAPAASSPTAKSTTTAGMAAAADGEQRKTAEDQAAKAKQKAQDERVAAQRDDNCKRAREAVATLASGQRIARINAKGEREILSDAQRSEETRRAQAVVASDCR